MVLVVFVAHMFRGRPPVETLLFSIALAVGLSPELLPAMLSVNLARGAQAMAAARRARAAAERHREPRQHDVLCTDKTGTLTEGVVQVEGAYDPEGEPSRAVLEARGAQRRARDRPAQPAGRCHRARACPI